MNNDPRGSMTQLGNLIFINNALIEEVSCSNDFFSEILISYAVRENSNTSIQTIRLNLNQKTLVLDESGQSICLCCLRPGMWINVIISSQMTRSNPPQANAFLVAIQRSPQASMPPQRPTPAPPMPPQRPTPAPPMPPQRPTPPPPMPPQQPNPRPGVNQPQQSIPPQMRPRPQRPNQSQMSNQLENSNENGMLNQLPNSNQGQIPNLTSNFEQFQMPSWMQNATNSSQM